MDSTTRPARKQVSEEYTKAKIASTSADSSATTHNIWWHQPISHESRRKHQSLAKSDTRCRPLEDSGKTQGTLLKKAYFCLHFAKGECSKGAECKFLHRLPLPTDQEWVDHGLDCFARPRYTDEREDMGGHGSFLLDNRTLYVGHISPETSQEEVRRHFGEWGEIESAKVFALRGFAFVTYKSRLCAEFAKEAMYGQSLDHGEILNIRWAKPDSNPRSAVVKEKRVWDEFEEKVDSIHQAREERREKVRKMMEEDEQRRQHEEEKRKTNLVGYDSSSDED